MTNPGAKAFLELVQRSGLVDAQPLRHALLACKEHHRGRLPAETDLVAAWLIQAGLLTRWQCDRLCERKHKGFFLGKYKLLDHLGTGGMSSVYLVEHTVLKTKRAMKILPKHRVGDTSYLARFQREAQTTAALEHPNIVRAFDMDQEGDRHYLIMEFIQGRDLQSIVQQSGRLDYDLAANIAAQTAEGLAYVHGRGLIHRDVKPANLLLDERGTVKILDLGLALVADDTTSLTLMYNENVIGTADYLPPEQALNSHDVDARADVYGLGCTLYFALTGHPPFADGTIAQRIVRHQTEASPRIQADRPDCPSELVAICNRMMCKRPADRYASCREVADALEQWLRQSGRLDDGQALDWTDKVAVLSRAATRITARWAPPPATRVGAISAATKEDAAAHPPAAPVAGDAVPSPPPSPSGLAPDLAAAGAADATSGSAVLIDPQRPAPPPILTALLTASAPADQTIVLSCPPMPRVGSRTTRRSRRQRMWYWSWFAAIGLTAICLLAGYWILFHLLAPHDAEMLHRVSEPVRNVPLTTGRDI